MIAWEGDPISNITVVIPVYNTPPAFLGSCIDSILRQTVQPRKILIIDDGSTDPETTAYLNLFQRKLPLFQIWRYAHNCGIGATMNQGLVLARTDFILKLDSDDIARPQLIEKLATFASTTPVDVLGCQCQNFGLTNFATNHPKRLTRAYALKSKWWINHTGVLLNRESIIRAGGYRSMPSLAEDYELWMRMLRRGYRRFYNLPDVLVDYRDHYDSLHHNISRFNGLMKRGLRLWLRAYPDF